jgi:hypothetical protein
MFIPNMIDHSRLLIEYCKEEECDKESIFPKEFIIKEQNLLTRLIKGMDTVIIKPGFKLFLASSEDKSNPNIRTYIAQGCTTNIDTEFENIFVWKYRGGARVLFVDTISDILLRMINAGLWGKARNKEQLFESIERNIYLFRQCMMEFIYDISSATFSSYIPEQLSNNYLEKHIENKIDEYLLLAIVYILAEPLLRSHPVKNSSDLINLILKISTQDHYTLSSINGDKKNMINMNKLNDIVDLINTNHQTDYCDDFNRLLDIMQREEK